MILHPNESPAIFSKLPGHRVLIDPNGHQIAQVSESDLADYLAANRLSAFPIENQTLYSQVQMLCVFPLHLQPVFEKLRHIPTVKLPLFSTAFGDVELSSYSRYYSRQSIQDIIVQGLNQALQTSAVVCYRAGSEESEIIGIGIGWRTWFLEDVLGNVRNGDVVVPPGMYPTLRGAVIRNSHAEPLSEYLAKLPV